MLIQWSCSWHCAKWKMNVQLTEVFLFSSLLVAFASSQSTAVPSWNVRPQNRTERLGQNASLSCSVENAAGRWLAWMKIGSDGVTSILFTDTSRFQAPLRYSVASNGNGDSTLYLTSIEKDDDALFQCDLQNSNLSAAAQITVLVNPGVPLIARNVSDDNLMENEFLQLSCESFGGNPPPVFKWFRNGVQLQNVVVVRPAAKFGKVSATVVWPLSRADFRANFTCTAEIKDVPDSLVSNGTVLLVKYAPVISFGPFGRLTVLENSTLRIDCNVTAYPEVNQSTVQWFKDGQHIANGAGFVKSFVSISDAGVYTCSARNFETRTANITVDVQYPPKAPPFQTFTAVEGSPLNLTIDFDANPPVNFTSMKWFNGTALVASGRFLSRSSVSRTNAGNYTVEARNSLSPTDGAPSLGLGKALLQLKVSYKPGQSTVVIPSSVVVGQTVEITCAADDLGDPVGELIWHKVGKNETYPRGNILRIVNAQLSDIGNYSCAAQNEIGSGLRDTKFLDISEPAKWTQSSLQNKSEILVNRTLDAIRCAAQGRPAPAIHWYKDGRPVDRDWFQSVVESQSSEGFRWSTTSALKWEGASRKPSNNSLRPEDAGIYSCRASVSTIENQTIDQATEIVILYPPLMSTEVIQVGIDPGTSSRVTCSALGFPIPDYRWLVAGAAVEADNGRYAVEASKNGSVLTVTNMTAQDAGVYICQATNAIGSSVMTFNLTLNSVPGQPTQLKVLSVTWESVELGWVPGSDGGIPQQFLVFFRLGTAPAEVGGSSRFNLTGLFPNTTYVIDVRSRNRLGVGATSNFVTQTTDAFVVPTPENVKYYRDSKILVCRLQFPHLDDFCIRLQFNTSDNNFQRNYSECDLQSDAEVRLDSVLGGTEPRSIGASLCLKRRPDVCSDTRNVEFVNANDLPVRVIIIVCCVCGGFLLIVLILLIAVCCCVRRKCRPYPDEQRTINAYESNVKQTGKDETDVGNSPSFYVEGIDNPTLYQPEMPPILYGKKGPYLDLYALDRSDSQGGSDSGVSVSEVPKTKRIIHEVIV